MPRRQPSTLPVNERRPSLCLVVCEKDARRYPALGRFVQRASAASSRKPLSLSSGSSASTKSPSVIGLVKPCPKGADCVRRLAASAAETDAFQVSVGDEIAEDAVRCALCDADSLCDRPDACVSVLGDAGEDERLVGQEGGAEPFAGAGGTAEGNDSLTIRMVGG